ncbi:MAG: outer membrane beta-barrel protein [Bacteroidetes bacterium]|jgi:hypothetical protein|nr:outer membrane beta-barrel protein [Bacteroidota bacterium]
MPLIIISFLLIFSSAVRAQDFSYKIQAGTAVSWMTTNDLDFDQQFGLGQFFIQVDGSYYFDDHYLMSIGIEYSRLNSILKQSVDTFVIDNQVFRNVNSPYVQYRGDLISIPVELGFQNKRDRYATFYPYAGLGIINHFLLNSTVQYKEKHTESDYAHNPGLYSISYSFFAGFKWNFADQSICMARIRYQEGILPVSQNPKAQLKNIGIFIGYEYKLE